MRFESFLGIMGEQSFFDLATAVQISGEERGKLRTQLSRWTRAGKLLSLRRGMYALATPYRRTPLNPAYLANHLYWPSYLSGPWALGFYGLIPEGVVTYTSVSTRVPRKFENAFGVFEYRNVKQSAFFGYRTAVIQQQRILIADPEKALLDLWHLRRGPWTADRMLEMRFQNEDAIDVGKLKDYAMRYESPRLVRAAAVWIENLAAPSQDRVTL